MMKAMKESQLVVTREAQAWKDGCTAHCDTGGREKHATPVNAVMVIELGAPAYRLQVARCAAHGDADLAAGRVLAEPVELVTR